MNEIIVKNWKLVQPEKLEGHWMTGEEIGKHLGYSEPRVAINKIFNRHEAKFKYGMDVSDTKLVSEAGIRNTRVFSERGVLKVIRYSNTKVADAVMDEVFDVYLAVREKAKERAISPQLPSPEREAASVISGWMLIAKEFEVPRHLAQIEAVKAAKIKTGVDCAPLLLIAPAQDDVPDEEIYLEVTKIGQLLGLGDRKGAEVNKFLKKKGLQKKVGKLWEATATGKKHSQNHQWFKEGCSGFNLKWRASLVKTLWEENEKEKEEEKRILAALPRQETIYDILE
jgi:prophage antirepressor-like protein